MRKKIIDISVPVSQIRDNCIIAISGFNMATTPEFLIIELFRRYNKEGHPKNIFIISDALPAVPGRALDYVAEKLFLESNQEFIKGVLMPFLGFSPFLQKMIINEKIEYYGWPIGITAYWFREIASGRPGLITKIGIDTFLDPRREGAALNNLGKENATCKVSLIQVGGIECLLYQAPEPNYSFIRASTSDEMGNLSMDDEGLKGTILSIAQATKANPHQGTVIAQVKWITRYGSIHPRKVEVPSPLIDYVIISPAKYHWQSGTIESDPKLSYKILPPLTGELFNKITKISMKYHEKVIARRVLLELIKILEKKQAPVLVNLGIGIPALISSIATEEEVSEYIVTILESGQWGGLALSGNDFGAAISPFALSTIPDVFSNFEGGIIDAASLGFLEIDKYGNVNPSILPNRIYGPGGFPVIAGGAPRTFFAGSFTGGTSKIFVLNNSLRIQNDGIIKKFVENVYKVVFSGNQALKYGHSIKYITERAVFELKDKGLILKEIAPGVDIEKDIIAKMNFTPIVNSDLVEMDKKLFHEDKMNIKENITQLFKK
ncbi:MAG: hypothetical protein MRJ93_04420 [Nitrososphaeraceae archaeon]|nr:hypothetical protein [Nitrososphaeraceae archaeon]